MVPDHMLIILSQTGLHHVSQVYSHAPVSSVRTAPRCAILVLIPEHTLDTSYGVASKSLVTHTGLTSKILPDNALFEQLHVGRVHCTENLKRYMPTTITISKTYLYVYSCMRARKMQNTSAKPRQSACYLPLLPLYFLLL